MASSWFGGFAQDLSDQVSRAAASVQRLSEQTAAPAQGGAQQGGGGHVNLLQAELQNAMALGERVRASVLSSVSDLGLLPPGEEEVSGAELSRSFETEACTLKDAAGGASAAEVEATLRRWAVRVEAQGDAGAAALQALLASHALTVVMLALARSKAGRHVIRGAAGRGSDAPGSVNAEAAAHLRSVLTKASAVPTALLERLLGLLADAGKGASKAAPKSAGPAKQVGGPEQDLRWVLALLTAALLDASEIALREAEGRGKALESALNAVEVAAAKGAPRPDDGERAAAPASIAGPGEKIWAEWPGDGRWYHARVAGRSDSGGEVEVEWLRPPEDVECGRDVEYLANILGEAVLAADPTARVARLPGAAVLPGGEERPAPVVPTGEAGWTQQLDSAEALSKSFAELKTMCEELHAAPTQQNSGAAEQAGKALLATATSLSALRAERGPAPVQVVSSTQEAAGEALAEGVTEQDVAELRQRATALQGKKEELLEQLRKLEEEEAVVKAELKRAVPGEDDAEAEKQAGFAAEASAVSAELEELLTSRGRAAAAIGAGLGERLPGAAASCLKAERTRRRRLEDLLSGLHAALWGPDAPAFAQNPAAMSAARTLVNRAGTLVEHAWRETVQLAAETLGDGGALSASSEEMTHAAKRYKEMRKELGANLDRLNKLEAQPPPAAASRAAPAPAPAPAPAAQPAAEPAAAVEPAAAAGPAAAAAPPAAVEPAAAESAAAATEAPAAAAPAEVPAADAAAAAEATAADEPAAAASPEGGAEAAAQGELDKV